MYLTVSVFTKVRGLMGKRIRNGLAILTMSSVFICTSINLYFLYVGLEGQEIWECIDEIIFFSSSIIMCASVLALYIKICIFDIFNPLIGMIVFIYLMMWLLSCVSVITSNYVHYWINLGLVLFVYLLLTLFTMCITAFYMDYKFRTERVFEEVETRVVTKGGKPNCYRIPLSGGITPRPSTMK